MNEEPKSIWKRPWKGWRGLLLWFVVLFAAAFVVFICIGLISSIENPVGKLILFALLCSFFAVGCFLAIVFVYWLCNWRHFKRFLFGLACFVTLIALFYAEEDWRGKHDWEKFKRAEEAKGEKFDLKDFIPPSVPDNENFAFSPVWIAEIKYIFAPERAEAWYGDRIYSEDVSKFMPLLPVSTSGLVGTNWQSQSHLPNPPEASGNWATAHLTDLQPWQAYYLSLEKNHPKAEIPITPQPQSPAQDVLLALSKFDPALEQLRKDSTLPYARFPVQYQNVPPFNILLPHLAMLKRYSQVLQLRALAELQNGQSEQALNDIKLSFRLMDSIHSEPFIISHLVRIAISQIMLQPIYEGLAEHKWSDAQLAELDQELGKLDFLADYELSMRGECALGISDVDYMRRTREIETQDFSTRSARIQIAWFIPAAFFYQNELTIAQMHMRWTFPLVNDQAQTVAPDKVQQNESAANNQLRHFHFYGIFARMIFPAISNAVKKYAYGQESVDLARVAIALERYRLAHENYPESLDALAPQFLEKIPHDIIGGQPLHYRHTDDGQFVLYSVGWNETDDGGVVVLNKGSTPGVNRDVGDWVWRYPAK